MENNIYEKISPIFVPYNINELPDELKIIIPFHLTTNKNKYYKYKKKYLNLKAQRKNII
jgi:hypothetical protein